MELTTQFNLDDVFYVITKTGNVAVWSINNILTSAVGHKVIYEMREVTTGAITTLSEAQLQTKVDEKRMVRNSDDLRSVLTKVFQERTEKSVEAVEKTKREFLKEKLSRTLNGNRRKAETSLEKLKEKLEIDDTNNNEIEKDVFLEDDLDNAQRVAEEIYESEVKGGNELSLQKKIEKRKAWVNRLKEDYNSWNYYKKEKEEEDPPF